MIENNNYNKEIEVTVFSKTTDTNAETKHKLSWGLFKKGVLGEHERVLKKENAGLFNGMIFKNNEGGEFTRRSAANVDYVTLLILDYDGGMSIEDAKEKFKNYEYAGYTSFSHKTERKGYKDCFRLVFPLENAVTINDFSIRKNSILEWSGDSDQSSTDKSRGFYLPSCLKENIENAEIWENYGELLDIEKFEKQKIKKYVFKENVKIEDDEKSQIKENLMLVTLNDWNEWHNVMWSMYGVGFTVDDFIDVTVNGNLMTDKTPSICRYEWAQSKNKTGVVGYFVNLFKKHIDPDFKFKKTNKNNNNNGNDMENEKNDEFKDEFNELDLTEFGNAELFIKISDFNCKFIVENKSWVFWDKKQWKIDIKKTATANIIRKVRNNYIQIKNSLIARNTILIKHPEFQNPGSLVWLESERLEKEIKWLQFWIAQCGSNRNMQATLNVAARTEQIAASILDSDNDPLLLGVKNGVYDINKKKLLNGEHAREAFIMQSCGVEYDASASSEKWADMVLRIACGDADLAVTMKMAFGQVLIGQNSDKFFFLLGSGNNGKTTMLDIIDQVLGDYSIVGSPDLFSRNKITNKEYYFAQWKGKRLINFNETAKDAVSLSEEIIKQTTDAPEIVARSPYGDPFTFQPQFTAFFSVNHLPNISNDPALWRRLVIIPFNYEIPLNVKNANFKNDMLKNHGSGVLNWLIEGAILYMENGNKIKSCKAVDDFTKAIKQDTDKIFDFLSYYTNMHPHSDNILAREVYAEYKEYSFDEKYTYGSRNFINELVGAGLIKNRGTANQVYLSGFSQWIKVNNNQINNGTKNNIMQLLNH